MALAQQILWKILYDHIVFRLNWEVHLKTCRFLTFLFLLVNPVPCLRLGATDVSSTGGTAWEIMGVGSRMRRVTTWSLWPHLENQRLTRRVHSFFPVSTPPFPTRITQEKDPARVFRWKHVKIAKLEFQKRHCFHIHFVLVSHVKSSLLGIDFHVPRTWSQAEAHVRNV